jgi:DNA-binding IclR family transcriptional regulator
MEPKQGTEARRIGSIETRPSRAVRGTVPAQHLEAEPPSSDGHRQATRSAARDLLNLLEELAGIERIGVTPLARLLGIPVATTYRMLRVLERTGYVEQLKKSKEYRLTLKLFELGCEVASKTTIRDVATVEIERLAEQTGMTTNLGVLVGGDVLYLSKIDTDDLLTLNLPPGSRAPATCTAMGKAMLAFDPRPVESIVGEGPYHGRTDYSIRTLDALKKELTAIQRTGYAVDRQELAVGLWCVAAPIPGPRDCQEGAISVSAYRLGMDEVESRQLGEIVVGFASRISSRIGDLGQMGDLGLWFR